MSKKDDNVVYLNIPTKLNIPVKRILKGAKKADLSEVVVVGYTKEGGFYFASSIAAGPETLWLLSMAQKKLLEIGEGDDG